MKSNLNPFSLSEQKISENQYNPKNQCAIGESFQSQFSVCSHSLQCTINKSNLNPFSLSEQKISENQYNP